VARRLNGRIKRALFALAAVVAGSALAAGCATQNGAALAKQACGYVNSSLSLYESSLTPAHHDDATHLQDEAYDQLQLGLQPAAIAAGDDPKWQALMTTISESSRVPEGVLVSALQQQCAVADG
jgi:uncharacterized protein (DUF1501 family)